MTTYSAKKQEIQREWFILDATDQVLGRLASFVATRLKGKHKAIYTPHVDTGDFFIVINADKVRITGNKAKQKTYHRHSGYPGGLKSITFDKLLDKAPEKVLEYAIKGMLPKNKLGRAMLKKLKIYSGTEHPHHAQQPQSITIDKETTE